MNTTVEFEFTTFRGPNSDGVTTCFDVPVTYWNTDGEINFGNIVRAWTEPDTRIVAEQIIVAQQIKYVLPYDFCTFETFLMEYALANVLTLKQAREIVEIEALKILGAADERDYEPPAQNNHNAFGFVRGAM